MALSRVKTWIAGEILSAADLNAEFNNPLNNALSLISPLTGALDFNGKELILDADGDTSITADTDDQIDFRLGGADDFKMTANLFDVLSGSSINVNAGASQKVAGVQTLTKGADVASASDLLVGIDGNIFDVTGTTQIDTIATKGIGTVIKLHFDGVLILAHDATNLVLPGAANITTAAGDEAEFCEYASADWRCTFYTKATGASVKGVVKNADGGITLTDTSGGAGAAPDLDFYRNSASPAINDLIGKIEFNGEDDVGSKVLYAWVGGRIIDPANASLDGLLTFRTVIAGAEAERATLGAGMKLGSPTGGDKGAGTLNATGLYINGAEIPKAYDFTETGDISIATVTPTGTLWSSSQSIVIPTKGVIRFVPYLRVDNGSGAARDYCVGLRINSTDYWVQVDENGTPKYSALINNAATAEYVTVQGMCYEASGSPLANPAVFHLDIEGMSIATGSQTVQPIIGTENSTATQTLKGATLTARLHVEIVDRS